MAGDPTKSDYELARAILSGVPDTRVNRGAVMIAAYVRLRIAELEKLRNPKNRKKP